MLGPILALLFAAVLIVFVASIERMMETARREAMRTLAKKLGWRFVPELDENWPAPSVFARGRRRGLLNTMHSTITIEGRQYRMRAGDAQCVVQTGRSSTRILFSYVLVDSPWPNVPPLRVRHEGIIDRFAEALGFDDIDFESEEFSRRFRVESPDRRFAWDFCHPRMIRMLLEAPEEAFELSHGFVTVANGDQKWRPDEFAIRIEFMKRLFELWPEHRKEAARSA